MLQNSGIKQHGQESLTSSRSEGECVSTWLSIRQVVFLLWLPSLNSLLNEALVTVSGPLHPCYNYRIHASLIITAYNIDGLDFKLTIDL